MIRAIIAIVLVACLTTAGSAQEVKIGPRGSWQRVTSIGAGTKTKVKRHGVRKRLTGRFVSASDTAIQIEVKGAVTSVAKTEIQQVSVAAGKRIKHTLLGAAVGGGLGAGIMGGVAAFGQREGADENWTGIFAVAGLALGAMIGAPVGLASSASYMAVYEVASPGKP